MTKFQSLKRTEVMVNKCPRVHRETSLVKKQVYSPFNLDVGVQTVCFSKFEAIKIFNTFQFELESV